MAVTSRANTSQRTPAPVTLVLGQLSRPFYARVSQSLERLLPAARVVIVPGASHFLPFDAP